MSQRQIKFRVWNKKRKDWVYGPLQEVNLFGETILLGEFMRMPIAELNHCEALQFTGMLDKGGNEIYDGDLILVSANMGSAVYGPYRVFWDNGSWCSCAFNDSEPLSTYKAIEVVGHIFSGKKYEGRQ